MKRPAFSLLAFLLAVPPALADAPYRDARLAGYLVGSWFHDEARPNTVLSYDRNFTPDGQFTGTIIAIRSASDRLHSPAAVRWAESFTRASPGCRC